MMWSHFWLSNSAHTLASPVTTATASGSRYALTSETKRSHTSGQSSEGLSSAALPAASAPASGLSASNIG